MSAASKSRLRGWIRGVPLYAVIGVVLTYASTLFIVALLPITTMNWGCRGVIHRAESGSRPYWRIRVWESPYGSTLQIHRTQPNATVLRGYFNLDGLTENERRVAIERPALRDVAFLPEWSRLRANWPKAIEPMDELVPSLSYWFEIRSGWPFLALGGEYSMQESGETEIVLNSAGVLPITRNTAFTGPWAGHYQLVAMPLVPQGWQFAGSVVFYGLVAFGVVTAVRNVRQRWRPKPGVCRSCGYDLRGSVERCPECGTAIG
jgi:hypothetical protein